MFTPNIAPSRDNLPKGTSSILITNNGSVTALINSMIVTPGDICEIMKVLTKNVTIKDIQIAEQTDDHTSITVDYVEVTSVDPEKETADPTDPVPKAIDKVLEPTGFMETIGVGANGKPINRPIGGMR